jgi:hypothetical protein
VYNVGYSAGVVAIAIGDGSSCSNPQGRFNLLASEWTVPNAPSIPDDTNQLVLWNGVTRATGVIIQSELWYDFGPADPGHHITSQYNTPTKLAACDGLPVPYESLSEFFTLVKLTEVGTSWSDQCNVIESVDPVGVGNGSGSRQPAGPYCEYGGGMSSYYDGFLNWNTSP